MGSEEYYRREAPASAALTIVSGVLAPIQNIFIDNKIRYVESLFSMVPDTQITIFYSELRHGLDYVIKAWDDSEQDPKITGFIFNPQRIKNRATYRVLGHRKI